MSQKSNPLRTYLSVKICLQFLLCNLLAHRRKRRKVSIVPRDNFKTTKHNETEPKKKWKPSWNCPLANIPPPGTPRPRLMWKIHANAIFLENILSLESQDGRSSIMHFRVKNKPQGKRGRGLLFLSLRSEVFSFPRSERPFVIRFSPSWKVEEKWPIGCTVRPNNSLHSDSVEVYEKWNDCFTGSLVSARKLSNLGYEMYEK